MTIQLAWNQSLYAFRNSNDTIYPTPAYQLWRWENGLDRHPRF